MDDEWSLQQLMRRYLKYHTLGDQEINQSSQEFEPLFDWLHGAKQFFILKLENTFVPWSSSKNNYESHKQLFAGDTLHMHITDGGCFFFKFDDDV